MTEKDKHLILRRKKFHIPDQAKRIFDEKELNLLEKYGSWMEGLHQGKIEPISEEQRDFIACLREDQPPKEEMFNIYWRYIYRIEILKTKSLNNDKKLIQDDREDWKKIRRSRF